MALHWLWVSSRWNEKMGSNSQSIVLGQPSRHKNWGQFTSKCLKDRTWRVYESDFMFDLSAGCWPKRCLAVLWTDHTPSSLPSNPFGELGFLGNLPCIPHHYSLSSFPCVPCFIFASFVWLVSMISTAQRIHLSYIGTYVHSTIQMINNNE